MSATIDQRVVEMRFDNAQFESATAQSMSTLDKLKEKLNFTGASKGLENVNRAANSCDMGKLSIAIETVQTKFSALEVMGVTALANITNSAVNAGKRIAESLTIDPIKTGFDEYELKMSSVQTIMASTGESIDVVNKYLDELNTYSDKTIYSFSDMTNSIGKFTNAGVKLDDAVLAIKGISNEAAVSGANAQEASRAMYNFAQALSAGYVKLIDWKSIENANMATVEFKTQLMESAVACKTLTKTADGMYKTLNGHVFNATRDFNEYLKDGWMSTDALIGALRDYADEETDIGKKAYAAAQDVKTFTMMMDTLTEAAQSGWGATWQIIIGDFEEAKALWTELSTLFGGIIDGMSNSRNEFLAGAFSSKWSDLTEKIEEAGINISDFQNKLIETSREHGLAIDDIIKKEGSLINALNRGKIGSEVIIDTLKKFINVSNDTADATQNAAQKVEDFSKIVNRVIRGDFGNGADRIKALADAGYDYAVVQDLVNKKLKGESIEIKNLTDAQMKNMGYTKEQISTIRDLSEQAEKAGTDINELIKSFDKPTGRELFIESLLNGIHGLIDALSAVKKAWFEVFNPLSSDQLYGVLESLNAFSKHLIVTEKDAENITRTFKGLFAILNIITTIAGGALGFAFRTFVKLLEIANVDILEFTASIGDSLSAFRDWLFKNNAVTKAFDSLLVKVVEATIKVKDWVKEFIALESVQTRLTEFQTTIKTVLENFNSYMDLGIFKIKDFIKYVKDMDSITIDDVGALMKKFKEDVIDYFLDISFLTNPFNKFLDNIKNDIKAHLDMTEKDLTTFKGKVFKFVDSIREKLSANIGFGELFTVGMGASLIYFIKKINDALQAIAGPITSFKAILDGLVSVLAATTKKIKAETIYTYAKAIAVLAASIALLSKIDKTEGLKAVGLIFVLCAALGALTTALSAINKNIGAGGVLSTIKISATFTAIATSILILAGSLKTIESIDPENINTCLKTLGKLAIGLTAFTVIISRAAPSLSGGAIFFLAFASSLGILANSLKRFEKLDYSSLKEHWKELTGIVVAISAIALAAKGVGVGSAVAILTTAMAIKMFIQAFDNIANLKTDKIKSNIDAFMDVFIGIAILLVAAEGASEHAAKAGVGILAMSAGVILIVKAIQMINNLGEDEIKKGTKNIESILILFAAVVAVSNFAGEHAAKAGVMLLMMSGAMLILTGVMVILKHLSPGEIFKGTAAIIAIGVMFRALIKVTQYAKECKSELVVMAITIALLATSIGALAMINTPNLVGATASLMGVLGVFSLLVMSTNLVSNSWKSLAAMAGVIGLLGGTLFALGNLPWQSSLAAAASLSVTLLALVGAMKIVENFTGMSKKTVAALVVMVGITGLLAAIIGILAKLNVGPTIEIAASLSILLLSLSAACAITSVVGTVAAGVMTGVVALAAFIGGVSLIMIAIGALVTYIPQIEQFLNTGIPILEQIGYGLGSFFGSITKGLIETAASSLPTLGTALGEFMTNAAPFMDGLNGMSPDIAVGAKNMAEALLFITGADLLDRLTSWLTGSSSLKEFGPQLAEFGGYFADYANAISGVDASVVSASASAAQSLAELATTIPNSGGLGEIFSGNNDMSAFGRQLVEFGNHLKGYGAAIVGLDSNAISSSVKSIEELIGMAKDMTGIDTNAVGSFGIALTRLAQTGVDGFVNAFTNAGPRAKVAVSSMLVNVTDSISTKQQVFQSAGQKLIEKFVSGIESKLPNVTKSVNKVVETAATAIKGKQTDFYNAGSFMAIGFGNGISEYAWYVKQKAVQMAKDAYEATMKELDAHSPSKVFMKVGSYVPSGFANGIAAGASKVKAAATKMASTAVKAVKDNIPSDVKDIVGTMNPDNGMKEIESMIGNITSNMDYGAGATSAFVKNYSDLSSIMGNTAGIENASQAITDYGQHLYDISSTNEKDTESMEKQKKKLAELTAEKEKLTKQINEQSNAYKKQKEIASQRVTTKTSKSEKKRIEDAKKFVKEYEKLKKDLEKTEKSITETNKKIEESEVEMVKHVREAYEQLRTSLADTVKNGIDPLKASLNTGVDLFSEFKIGELGEDENLLENMKSQLDGVRKWKDDLGKLASRGLTEGLIDKLRDMGPTSAKYVKAFMEMTNSELKTANKAFEETTKMTADTLIENFSRSIAETKQWVENIKTLSTMGLDQSLIEALGKMGTSSGEYVNAFLAMSADDIATFNEQYAEYLKLPDDAADSLIASFVYAGSTAAKEFAQALAAGKDNEEVTTEAVATGEAVAEGVETGVENKKTELTKESTKVAKGVYEGLGKYLSEPKGEELGENICNGIIAGLQEGSNAVTEMAKQVAKAAYDAAKAALAIHSPSKKFEELGMYSDMGFANGLEKYAKYAVTAASDLGNDAIYGLKNSIRRISDVLEGNIDYEPVIRPVIDLTDVEAGARKVGSLFSANQSLRLANANGIAYQAANSMRNNNVQTPQQTIEKQGAVIKFEQNNYSPTALSRLDIYRQTKNQFAAMKGVLDGV